MSINSGLRVYVLGAGCSYDGQHGYPLANGFLSELKAYAVKIQDRKDCKQIKEAVQQTIDLLHEYRSGQYQASTIDQLVNLILTDKCDDFLRRQSPASNIEGLRLGAVRNAQISTSACFLEKEGLAMDRLLPKYKAFIRRIFNENEVGTPHSTSLQNSNVRVFSFNYDRLFELAFVSARVAEEDMKVYCPYKVLNSGLYVHDTRDLEIMKDRFCFIKLHGSIGFRCIDKLGYGQKICWDGDIGRWKQVKVTDEMFFATRMPGGFRDSPLVVFPYDKKFVRDGKTSRLPNRDYIEKVWKYAEYVFPEAAELFVIGYSFSDWEDSNYLVDLIRRATNCHQIEIQNLPNECTRISNLLKDKHQIRIPIKMNPVKF